MAKNEANNKKEKNKNKKSFWKDFKAELKKVVWPTPKQLLNNTIAVVTIVLITAAIVFVLDLVFETINKQGIDRVRELVVTENENTTVENTNNETTETETTEATETETTETSEEETPEETNTQNEVE